MILAELRDACDLLAQHPRITRERIEIRPSVRSHRIKSDMIIYDIDLDGTMVVSRFRHVRENWQSDPVSG